MYIWTSYFLVKGIALLAFLFALPEQAPAFLNYAALACFVAVPFLIWIESLIALAMRPKTKPVKKKTVLYTYTPLNQLSY